MRRFVGVSAFVLFACVYLSDFGGGVRSIFAICDTSHKAYCTPGDKGYCVDTSTGHIEIGDCQADGTAGLADCDDGTKCPVSCFLPGTEIKTPKGMEVVEKVKVGDVVKSFEDGKVVESKVSQIFERERDFYFALKAGKYEVKASAEHPFLMWDSTYKQIQYLVPGDKVFVIDGDKMVLETVVFNTRVNEKTKVYNMSVDNTHTYFANGFAVHNKGGGYEFPTCTTAGTSLSCGSPATMKCFKYVGDCGGLWPSRLTSPDVCGDNGTDNINCQNNCGCCAAGESYVSGGTYQHTYTSNQTADRNDGTPFAVDPRSCGSAGTWDSTEPVNGGVDPQDYAAGDDCHWIFHPAHCTWNRCLDEWWELDYCTFTSNCTYGSCQVPNGQCDTTHNNCLAGTASNPAETISQYLWSCVGSAGGTTASCSETKPPLPPTVTASCVGNSGVVAWTTPETITDRYLIGLNNLANPWASGACPDSGAAPPIPAPFNGDACLYTNSNSFAYNGIPGHDYTAWVYSINSAGKSNQSNVVNFTCNVPPTFTGLSVYNSDDTLVSFDADKKNHICKSSFRNSTNPTQVKFVVNLQDLDGGSEIKTAQMRWNGTVTNLVIGDTTNANVSSSALINYSGVNVGATYPIEIRITDIYSDTGWINSGYYWKVWDCGVAVMSNVYDGSAGQACNNTGFTTPLSTNSINYKNMSGGSDQTNNLVWTDSYLPLVNGGSVMLPDGNLQATGRFTRLIDKGVGTTICPSSAQFDVSASISAYSVNPSLQVDLSYIRDQEGWFQGRGLDIRAKNEISSGVPVTANSALSIDNISIGSSSNGLVASASFRNTNGNNDGIYGIPNNWYYSNFTTDPNKYGYQTIYKEYFGKMAIGDTGVTVINTGDTGVKFVNGNLTISNNVVVAPNKFLMVVVSGTIDIDPAVTRIDGIYLSDTGINALGTNSSQLVINGILYSLGNIRLARSFTVKSSNNSAPAIVVNYRSDLIFAMPGKLNKIVSNWNEK